MKNLSLKSSSLSTSVPFSKLDLTYISVTPFIGSVRLNLVLANKLYCFPTSKASTTNSAWFSDIVASFKTTKYKPLTDNIVPLDIKVPFSPVNITSPTDLVPCFLDIPYSSHLMSK